MLRDENPNLRLARHCLFIKDTHGVFSEPVDPEELPDYHDIIKQPMDYGTVRKKLDKGLYPDLEQFEVGVAIFWNRFLECDLLLV
ncbi:hypothetical protein Fmac_033011 [Flemingia macrophylla]|uniref:Bromo domain-containing protein n=1 Tax=Flemingia macrophylla TaxID=520843 RepID=A0ABD1L6J3_9FABA